MLGHVDNDRVLPHNLLIDERGVGLSNESVNLDTDTKLSTKEASNSGIGAKYCGLRISHNRKGIEGKKKHKQIAWLWINYRNIGSSFSFVQWCNNPFAYLRQG